MKTPEKLRLWADNANHKRVKKESDDRERLMLNLYSIDYSRRYYATRGYISKYGADDTIRSIASLSLENRTQRTRVLLGLDGINRWW